MRNTCCNSVSCKSQLNIHTKYEVTLTCRDMQRSVQLLIWCLKGLIFEFLAKKPFVTSSSVMDYGMIPSFVGIDLQPKPQE